MNPPGAGPTVLLTTEGTYPFHRGGVSTWCDALTRQLPEVDFRLLAVTMHPYLTPHYPLADNITQVIRVPLWGTEDPAEYGHHGAFPDFLRCRWGTTARAIEERFLPLYESLLGGVVGPPRAPEALGPVLLAINEQLQQLDYHRAFTDLASWNAFNRITREAWERRFPGEPPPSVEEVRNAWRLLYRLLLPLAVKVPRVDLTHSAAAAFCGLPCIIAKLRWGTPYLLTEHGVYLREQYLNLGKRTRSLFGRWFLFQLISAIVDVNYALADQVSPVCAYNTRWERWRDVHPSRIRVIHNGVDPVKFSPVRRHANERPTVVSVGLIFPLKGQLDLIEAAALVRRHQPDVLFRVYGSASDDAYFRRCQERVRALGLEHHVEFMGTTAEPWVALRQADAVALPSISEAFPYALVEAMLTEAVVVATDVGGVREAMGDTGVLVHPHDPAALADALVRLLTLEPAARERLGRHARERALRWFTEQRFLEAYRSSYAALVSRAARGDAAPADEPPQSLEAIA